MVIQTNDNKFSVAEWIVDPIVGDGTHTTIQAAINDATAGEQIFIRRGIYSDPITLKAGVDLVTFQSDETPGSAVITGKVTANHDGR